KEHWARGGKILPNKQADELQSLAAHCSERERAATSAEREIDAFYSATLMQKHVGEQFAGTIASVAEFGLFIELSEPYVEGLVRAETIAERWKLDTERHRLVIGDGTRSYGVGEAIQVEIESSNPITRRIEMRLIEGGRVVPPPLRRGPPPRSKMLIEKAAGQRRSGKGRPPKRDTRPPKRRR